MKKKLLLTPGPANVPSNIRKASAQDLIHHRKDEFKRYFSKCIKGLRDIIKLGKDDKVVIVPASGSGGLEMVAASLFSPGDEVILINIGFFGEFWSAILKEYNIKVHTLKYQRGKSYKIEDVEKALKKHKKAKAIFVTHNETSSGVLNPIKPLGLLTKKYKKLLCVDSISGLIMNKFEFKKLNVDAMVSASQKGFMMAPGLSFVAMSKKAVDLAAKDTKQSKRYLCFNRHLEFLKVNTFPSTSPVAHIFALDESIKMINKIGLEKLQKQKHQIRQYTQDKMLKLGFELFSDKKYISNSMIALTHAKIIDNTEYLSYLEKHNIYLAAGLPPIKKQYIRIGFLGIVKKKDINKLVKLTKKYLSRIK